MTKARATGTTGGAKGAIVVGTGSTTAAPLTVGTDGQVLTAASGQTTGLQWATPSSGGMTLIATTTLTGSTVTISSIPSTYISLFFVFKDFYGTALSDSGLRLTMNGDLTTKYHYAYYGVGTGGSAIQGSDYGNAFACFGCINTSSTNANLGSGTLFIPRYSDTTANVTFSAQFACNIATAVSHVGTYENRSAAISSISFSAVSGTWSAGTVYTYGVK